MKQGPKKPAWKLPSDPGPNTAKCMYGACLCEPCCWKAEILEIRDIRDHTEFRDIGIVAQPGWGTITENMSLL